MPRRYIPKPDLKTRTKAKKLRLSDAQYRVLRNLLAGFEANSHCKTKSDYGGLHGTTMSLQRAGLITNKQQLTPEGRRHAISGAQPVSNAQLLKTMKKLEEKLDQEDA